METDIDTVAHLKCALEMIAKRAKHTLFKGVVHAVVFSGGALDDGEQDNAAAVQRRTKALEACMTKAGELFIVLTSAHGAASGNVAASAKYANWMKPGGPWKSAQLVPFASRIFSIMHALASLWEAIPLVSANVAEEHLRRAVNIEYPNSLPPITVASILRDIFALPASPNTPAGLRGAMAMDEISRLDLTPTSRLCLGCWKSVLAQRLWILWATFQASGALVGLPIRANCWYVRTEASRRSSFTDLTHTGEDMNAAHRTTITIRGNSTCVFARCQGSQPMSSSQHACIEKPAEKITALIAERELKRAARERRRVARANDSQSADDGAALVNPACSTS